MADNDNNELLRIKYSYSNGYIVKYLYSDYLFNGERKLNPGEKEIELDKAWMPNSEFKLDSNSEDYFNKLTGDLCIGLSQFIDNNSQNDVVVTGDKSMTAIMLFLTRKCEFEKPLKIINTSFDLALNVPIKAYTEWYKKEEVGKSAGGAKEYEEEKVKDKKEGTYYGAIKKILFWIIKQEEGIEVEEDTLSKEIKINLNKSDNYEFCVYLKYILEIFYIIINNVNIKHMYVTLRNYHKNVYNKDDFRNKFITQKIEEYLLLRNLLEIDIKIFKKIMLCSEEENTILNNILVNLIKKLDSIIKPKKKEEEQEET